MYKIINEQNLIFTEYEYADEAEYEKMIVSKAETIFGSFILI